MANIGYIRVSTIEQNTSRQLEKVKLDKIFEEKISSSVVARPVLAECLNYLREGDTLHVHSIDRLARNLIELQTIVQDLNKRGVTVHFHAENMLFSYSVEGKPQPMQELLFQILGAFAQFERSLIKERQLEGIARAKKEGRQLGRPSKVSKETKTLILQRLEKGESASKLAEEYGLDVSGIHKWRKRKECIKTS